MQIHELLSKTASTNSGDQGLSAYIQGIQVLKQANQGKEASIRKNMKALKQKLIINSEPKSEESTPAETPKAMNEIISTVKETAAKGMESIKGLSNTQKGVAAAAIIATPIVAHILHKHLSKKKDESLDKVANDSLDEIFTSFKEASFRELSQAWEADMIAFLGQ